MGVLGMQAGAGQALSDIGKMGFQSALEEDRMKRIAEYKGDGVKPTVVSKGGALVDPTGKVLYQNPDTGDGAGMDSKVELKNGQIVKESDLRSEYNTRYGKYDPVMQQFIMDENAPTFDEYRNQMVSPKYVRGYEPTAKPEDAIPMSEARAMAEREANDKAGWLSSDESDFGKGGKEQWINNRALEIMGKPSKSQIKPSYKHSSGKVVTREQIEQTAKNRGITPEEVIQKLGLQ